MWRLEVEKLIKRRLSGLLIEGIAVLMTVPAFAAPEIVPTTVGNKWQYSVVKLLRAKIAYQDRTVATLNDPSSGTSVYEVVSVDDGVDPPIYDYRETTDLQSVSGNTNTDKVHLSITNKDGVLSILSTLRAGQRGDKDEKQVYEPPLMYFTTDAASGKSWEVGEMRDGDVKAPTTARGAGRETVTVPAGTFKDCLKVIYSSENGSGTIQLWDKEFKITSGRSRGIYWIAEGVGVVKELEVSTSTAESPGPDGKPVTVEATSCLVSELMPGYVVK